MSALRPLNEISLFGLATLAVFSLAWSKSSETIHYLGAGCFFFGMEALSGLTLYTQHELASRFPEECEMQAGISVKSERFQRARNLFILTAIVQVIFDWGGLLVSFVFLFLGDDRPACFVFGYLGAVTQWTIILLLSIFALSVAENLSAWPDEEKQRITPSSNMKDTLKHGDQNSRGDNSQSDNDRDFWAIDTSALCDYKDESDLGRQQKSQDYERMRRVDNSTTCPESNI
jgi:hypothetical protein